jgi:hypothetical protein
MASGNEPIEIYSAGDCPVCADSGAVVLLKARGSGRFFFVCPLCEVAWAEPPPPNQLDAILNRRLFAPEGAVLPTPGEASSTGFQLTALAADEWYSFVRDLLD